MKNIKFTYTKTYILIGCMLMTLLGCERELSDDAVFATFPKNGDVFIDAFSAGLDYF